jgi:hypothetical protein
MLCILVFVRKHAVISGEQWNTLNEVSVNKIVGSVLSESDTGDDISSDIDIQFVWYGGHTDINSAIQLVPVKCTKVAWKCGSE